MKSFAPALIAGTLILAGCAMPFGASNVGSATIGGFFPAAKDALWSYEVSRVTSANATPSMSVYAIEVKNVTKTNDNAAVLYETSGSYTEVMPTLPNKFTKDKAFVYPTGGNPYTSYEDQIEQFALPLKKDATWTFKVGTNSVEVKAVDEPEITVTAGKFKTVHLTYTAKDAGNMVYKETWMADGVGMVKGVFSGTATSTLELSSYHL